MTNTLIIVGHPDAKSFNYALADAYEKGLQTSGVNYQRLNLVELDFDPILKYGYREKSELEPDLLKAKSLIEKADHLVFIYPLWWASMPALLKGFIDRLFLPGFAFKYTSSVSWKKLLKGKTARLIITMDAPPLYFKLKYGNSGIKVMSSGILKFCGIKSKVTKIGSVRLSSESKKQKWLEQIKKLGKNNL